MQVAAKAIELRHCYRALEPARFIERSGKLGAAIQRVRALPGFNLDK